MHPPSQSPPGQGKIRADALLDGLPSVTNVAGAKDGSDQAGTNAPIAEKHAPPPAGDNASRPDDSIVDDLIGRLGDDPKLDASEILVMVQDGLVTLTGNVPEAAMSRRAEALAAEADGVRSVQNRLRVDDGSSAAGPPGEAIRSGQDQLGSGFSSSQRPDPLYDNSQEDSNWPGKGAL